MASLVGEDRKEPSQNLMYLALRSHQYDALDSASFSNSMVFRFLLLLSLFVARLAWSQQATESDQYLQRLTETRNFSIGRPTHVEPTADGKSVIFLRAISDQDRTKRLYE